MIVTSKEAKQARAFLFSRGFNSQDIPPRLFAMQAKKLNKSFQELLSLIAIIQTGNQGGSQSPLGRAFTGDEY
jgi:hypothetical protein